MNIKARLIDWRTTGPGTALTIALAYFCPDLIKDLSSPSGLMAAALALGPAILGALSHSSK